MSPTPLPTLTSCPSPRRQHRLPVAGHACLIPLQVAALASTHQLFVPQYEGEEQDMGYVQALVDPELSEPYSIFTYRLAHTQPICRNGQQSRLLPRVSAPCSSWAWEVLPWSSLDSSLEPQ